MLVTFVIKIFSIALFSVSLFYLCLREFSALFVWLAPRERKVEEIESRDPSNEQLPSRFSVLPFVYSFLFASRFHMICICIFCI